MPYDIIIRFPSKEIAEEFCEQMEDGFGEGLCDFSSWKHTIGEDGKCKYEKTTSSAPEGTRIFFINNITEF